MAEGPDRGPEARTSSASSGNRRILVSGVLTARKEPGVAGRPASAACVLRGGPELCPVSSPVESSLKGDVRLGTSHHKDKAKPWALRPDVPTANHCPGGHSLGHGPDAPTSRLSHLPPLPLPRLSHLLSRIRVRSPRAEASRSRANLGDSRLTGGSQASCLLDPPSLAGCN